METDEEKKMRGVIKDVLILSMEIVDEMKDKLGIRSNTDRRICIFATAKLVMSMLVIED